MTRGDSGTWRPAKIISGGQTGADRGGLDAALHLDIPIGGWCPRGRRAEDGRIPMRYALRETSTVDYPLRTELNVVYAHATLIFSAVEKLERGSLLTRELAAKHRRPWLVVIWVGTRTTSADLVRGFLQRHKPDCLNVAGSRESKASGIQVAVRDILIEALS